MCWDLFYPYPWILSQSAIFDITNKCREIIWQLRIVSYFAPSVFVPQTYDSVKAPTLLKKGKPRWHLPLKFLSREQSVVLVLNFQLKVQRERIKMGIGTSAILGDTNKFFLPWLIPRNDRDAIFRPNILGKLVGRTKREDFAGKPPLFLIFDWWLLRGFWHCFADLNLFTLRIDYCEQKGLECLTQDPSLYGQEMQIDQPLKEFEGKYSWNCKQIVDQCLQDHDNLWLDLNQILYFFFIFKKTHTKYPRQSTIWCFVIILLYFSLAYSLIYVDILQALFNLKCASKGPLKSNPNHFAYFMVGIIVRPCLFQIFAANIIDLQLQKSYIVLHFHFHLHKQGRVHFSACLFSPFQSNHSTKTMGII